VIGRLLQVLAHSNTARVVSTPNARRENSVVRCQSAVVGCRNSDDAGITASTHKDGSVSPNAHELISAVIAFSTSKGSVTNTLLLKNILFVTN